MMKAVLMAKLQSKGGGKRQESLSKLEGMERGEAMVNGSHTIEATTTKTAAPTCSTPPYESSLSTSTNTTSGVQDQSEKQETAMNAQEVAFIDDSLSSIFFFFVNAGQLLGPLLCGPATNNVPQVDEMGCNTNSTECQSGYPWTASIAAFVMFCI